MTMTKILHAFFDGKVLMPAGSVQLEVGKRYLLTIESNQRICGEDKDPTFDLSSLAVKTNHEYKLSHGRN